jgi:hypothetical protein
VVKARTSVPQRNRSPYGWWLATYLARFELRGAAPHNSRSRCLVWESTVLVRAKTREAAYRSALRLARSNTPRHWRRYGPPPGRLGRWVLEGLSDLLPIYEPLRHGAEIQWAEHRNTTLGWARQRVKGKHELRVFDDG